MLRTRVFREEKDVKKLLKWICICFLAGAVALTGLMCAVIVCAGREYEVRKSDCIIVLGARVWADGTLSTTFRARADAAAEAFASGVSENIIVCGGQGSNEPTSEAQAARDYLIQKGVPQGNIYLEDQSTSTKENLLNAQIIMRAQNWTTAAIVTNGYHLTRAMWIAGDLQMDVCGIAAGYPVLWTTKIANYARESLSWVFYWLRSL